MKVKQYICSAVLVILCLLSLGAKANNTQSEYDRLAQSPPAKMGPDTWEKGLESYFSSCANGSCKCTLIISEKVDGSTANTWIGNFARGSADGMFMYSPIQESGHPAPGSGNNRSYAMDLGKCHTGRVKATGDNCCVVDASNKRTCGSENCKYYQVLANQMGIPVEHQDERIYFASTLHGVFYLHESPYECSGPPCIATRGCVTLPAVTMKSLCQNYIGTDTGATGVAHPENGGAYFFFKNTSMPKHSEASRDKAIKGFENYRSQCGNQSFASIYGGNSGARASANYQMGRRGPAAISQGQSFDHSDDNGRRQSSGGNFFSQLFSAIFGGGSGVTASGPAGQSGAYDLYQQSGR